MGWRWELGNFKGKYNGENKWDGGGNLGTLKVNLIVKINGMAVGTWEL